MSHISIASDADALSFWTHQIRLRLESWTGHQSTIASIWWVRNESQQSTTLQIGPEKVCRNKLISNKQQWTVGCKNSLLTVLHVYLAFVMLDLTFQCFISQTWRYYSSFLPFMNCVRSKCFCHADIKVWNTSTGQSHFIHCRSVLINITWMCFHTDWYSVLSVESCSI